MTMREKLIELLDTFNRDVSKYAGDSKFILFDDNVEVADYLIANGVTLQKWIPVTERLPEGMDWVACACKDGEIRILCYDYIMDDWDIHDRPNSCYAKGFVTHWMPLPEPPKGE